MDAQEREKDVVDAFRHSMMTILMKRRSDERSDRNYSMADDQINEFEGTYDVEYDPSYEEPYMVDELPDDMSFVEDKVYARRDRFSIATKATMICIGGKVADLFLNSSGN